MKKPAPIKPLDPVLADFVRALARETARIDHEKMMRGELDVPGEIEIRPIRRKRRKISQRVSRGQDGCLRVEVDIEDQKRLRFFELLKRVHDDMRAGRDDELGFSKLLKK
jgi:hypothetical protein